MLWLLVLVAIVQATFYWVLKPLILVSTPIFEVRFLGIACLLAAFWLISGKE